MALADYFRGRGFRASVEKPECVAELPWDVVMVSDMLPSHSDISKFALLAATKAAFEEMLEEAASPLGGRNDGWGCSTLPTSQ